MYNERLLYPLLLTHHRLNERTFFSISITILGRVGKTSVTNLRDRGFRHIMTNHSRFLPSNVARDIDETQIFGPLIRENK